MRVYRVELRMSSVSELDIHNKDDRKSNIGPYCNSRAIMNFVNACGFRAFRHGLYAQGSNCPELSEEHVQMEDYQEKWLFGFSNLKQYFLWFTEFSLNMHCAGYVLAEYEVPDGAYVVTQKQLIFDIEQSILCNYIYLDELHNRNYVKWERTGYNLVDFDLVTMI